MTRKQKKVLIRSIVSGVLLLTLFLLFKFLKVEVAWWIQLLCYLVPYLIIGYDVLLTAFKNILHGRVFDEMFLMTIATIGAFFVQEYPETVAVMLFYQIGELFQGIAVGKSRKSITSLMKLRPDVAVVVRNGEEIQVSPEEVEVGEIVVVRPGEKIPLDGEVIEGNTSIDTSALTGESCPRDILVGDNVVGGSVNLNAVIKVKVASAYHESTVAKILELVENASEKKSKSENFISKFARYYTPIVVICALLLAVIPPMIINISSWAVWSSWIQRGLIFLVVSCPCALVISVPLSFFGGIGGASKQGILIKGSNYLELLSKVDTVVFDKTGTLTKGGFEVTEINPESGITADELLEITALAESFSLHPIAKCIVSACKTEPDKSRLGEVKEMSGYGIVATVDGENVYVGNKKLLAKINPDWTGADMFGTVVYVCTDNKYLGYILVEDAIKPQSKQAIQALKSDGVGKTVMLTGDSEGIAKKVSAELGLDEYHAELLPNQKVEQVEELMNNLSEKSKLAFVGDGINDAPVLMRADVGVAMGALGSDSAIEAADVVLMDDNPEKLAVARNISVRTMRLVYENIIFALAVKLIVLVLSAFGLANMWLAVVADVGVMVLAILNAMRALRFGKKKTKKSK